MQIVRLGAWQLPYFGRLDNFIWVQLSFLVEGGELSAYDDPAYAGPLPNLQLINWQHFQFIS